MGVCTTEQYGDTKERYEDNCQRNGKQYRPCDATIQSTTGWKCRDVDESARDVSSHSEKDRDGRTGSDIVIDHSFKCVKDIACDVKRGLRYTHADAWDDRSRRERSKNDFDDSQFFTATKRDAAHASSRDTERSKRNENLHRSMSTRTIRMSGWSFCFQHTCEPFTHVNMEKRGI